MKHDTFNSNLKTYSILILLILTFIAVPNIQSREVTATPSLREGPFRIVAIGDSLIWGNLGSLLDIKNFIQ